MFKVSSVHNIARAKKKILAGALVLCMALGGFVVTATHANAAEPALMNPQNPELDFGPTAEELAELTPDSPVFAIQGIEPDQGGQHSLSTTQVRLTVRNAQKKLLDAGYWHSGVDGKFGLTTKQAIYAFQKQSGLKRTGLLDAKTSAALSRATRPARGVKLTNGMEIDKKRQIIKVIRKGKVVWVFNTSTGSGKRYKEKGGEGVAVTPNGTFEFFRAIDGMRHAPLGDLYRPRYFNGGIAIHGADSVPPYPASHGCARVSNPAINFIWDEKLAPIGGTVIVH